MSPTSGRTILTGFAAVIALSASPTMAGETCGPGKPPCDEPHDGPGCLQPQCCEIVCDVDVFCCDVQWDSTCVEVAVELCGDVRCPEEGECLEVHDTAGCIDETCCELVRMHDPFCGYGTWDEWCVEGAEEWCAASLECPIDPPVGAIDELESCLDRINDGCGRDPGERSVAELACGDVVYGKSTTSVPRDVDAFIVDLPAGSMVEAVVRSEFPGRLILVVGECEGPIGTRPGPAVEPCGGEVSWMFKVPSESWYLALETGIDGRVLRSGLPCDEIDPKDPPDDDEEPEPRVFGLHYLLSVDCQEACVGDLDGDGEVGGSDLGLLFVSWGPCSGNCEADLDEDGVVGGSDLGLLFVAWGDC